MKKPAFWKVSMGGNDFDDILEVFDYLRRGLVVVYKDTKKMAFDDEPQGKKFIDPRRDGDYFYLCHGNRTKAKPRHGIVLFGRFTGKTEPVVHHKWTDHEGWVGRGFEWIKTAVAWHRLSREDKKKWTPNYDSTFIQVPHDELKYFERLILKPYFDLTFSKLGLKLSDID